MKLFKEMLYFNVNEVTINVNETGTTGQLIGSQQA
jgi:hypothetical protein